MAEILKKRFHRPLVIAHRGLSQKFPENTLAAFEAAAAAGADMVELDIHTTADGELVCIHDDVLNRYLPTRSPAGLIDRAISTLTLAEVQSIDAGSWKDPQFKGAVIPRLDDVLARFSTMGDAPVLLIERKSGTPRQVIDLLNRHDAAERVIVQSFDCEFMAEFRSLAPTTAIALLHEQPMTAEHVSRAREMNASALHWWANELRLTNVERCHAAGLLVWAFTVNSELAWRGAAHMHVDGITTDRCNDAMQVLCSAMR